MVNIKNILTIAILTLLMTVGTSLAQDNTGGGTTTDQDRTGTSGQSQSGNTQDDMSLGGNQDEDAFTSTAQQLASDLVTRLNLQQDKSQDIADVIVDYRNNIAEIKMNQRDATGDNNTGMTGEGTTGEGTTGTGTDATGDNQTGESTGMTGDQGDVVGGSNNASLMQAYSDADMEANEKIEDAIGEENVQQYMTIKREWWSDVKERVHASVSSMGTGMGTDDGTGTGTDEGTGSGTGTDKGTGTGTGTDDGTGTGTEEGSGSGSGSEGSGSGSGGY